MKTKRRPIVCFEARSVMLLSAWVVGAATAQAQMPGGAGAGVPARSGAQLNRPADGSGSNAMPPPPVKEATPDIHSVFDRVDTNKDGKLNRAELERLPAMAQRFNQIDTNRDGLISREEFEKAVKP